MKILIASGGTKVPMDSVRSIINMSTGSFGSKIACCALEAGHDVTFLYAEGSRRPMKPEIDCFNMGTLEAFEEVTRCCVLAQKFQSNYKQVTYKNFEDYHYHLSCLLRNSDYDAVFLSTAASDYGIDNPHKGKVRSTKEDLTIHLTPLPKLIGRIREWASPDIYLIGFKLLVNSSKEGLLNAAWGQLQTNKCNVVVANDLSDMRKGKHKIHLVREAVGEYQRTDNKPFHYETFCKDENDPFYLARTVVEQTIKGLGD